MNVIIHNRDSLDWLSSVETNSIGAVVCDPPYELGFMGKAWDGSGIAFSEPLWSEVFRVLVPGGRVTAFSATRTFHRLAAVLERVGFEGLTVEAWTYGSGFPKSLSVSVTLDKIARGAPQGGRDPHKRGSDIETSRAVLSRGGGTGKARTGLKGSYSPFTPATPEAVQWDGWGTALKPAWEPFVVGRKPAQ